MRASAVRMSAAAVLGVGLMASAGNAFVEQRISTGLTPVIDGKVGASEWADAARLPAFLSVAPKAMPYAESPELYIKFDDTSLYIAMVSHMAFDPEAADPLPHDAMTTRDVDSLEITLCVPDQHYWYKFVVERGGGQTELRYHLWDVNPPADYNAKWAYRHTLTPDAFFVGAAWKAEIAIPWTSIGLDAPQEQLSFPAQFVRFHGNSKFGCCSIGSWARTRNIWDLPDPGTFGALTFVPGKNIFRYGKGENFEKGRGRCTGRLVGSPGFRFKVRIWKPSDWNATYPDANYTPTDFPGNELDWQHSYPVKAPETVLWAYVVSDADGVVARNQGFATIHPPFFADVARRYVANEVVWLGTIALDPLPANASVEVTLVDTAGKVVASKTVRLALGQDWFEARLPADRIPLGEAATAKAMLLNASGKVLRTAVNPLDPVPKNDWVGVHPGTVTEPMPPWQPLTARVEGNEAEITVFIHKLYFRDSLLPDRIVSLGEALSAVPWRFVVEAGGRELPLETTAPIKLEARDARGVTLSWGGGNRLVSVAGTVRVEFDGLAWYDFEVTPRQPGTQVGRFAIATSFKGGRMRYMSAVNAMQPMRCTAVAALIGAAKTDDPIPAINTTKPISFSGKGWRWDNQFFNYIRIAGEDRAVYFVQPSKQNIDIKGDYLTVTDGDEAFGLQLNLIEGGVEFSAPRHYTFGFMLTPSHKINGRSRLRRLGAFFSKPAWNKNYTRNNLLDESVYGQYGPRFMHPAKFKPAPKGLFTCPMLPCWTIKDCQSGNPRPDAANRTEIDNHVRGIRASIGGMPTLWFDSLITATNRIEEIAAYVKDFQRHPVTLLPIETPATFVCAKGCWPDYYLTGVQQRLAQGVECLYWDMTSMTGCTNRFHACGWRDGNGEVHPTIPFLETREFVLRAQKVLKDNNPDSVIILHGGASTPLALWCDATFEGEEWSTATDYSGLAPELFQVQYMFSRNSGVANLFFAGLLYFQYPNFQRADTTQQEVWGMALLHDEAVWNANPLEIPGNRMVWEATSKFGIDEPDAVWTPYWRNRLSAVQTKAVKVSSYERRGKQLLVVFNYAYEPRPVDLAGAGHLTDAFTGEAVPDVFEIGKRGFRLLTAE